MEKIQLTIDQAIKNVEEVCENHFIGKKQDHLILQLSLELIKKELEKNKDT